MPLLRVVGEAVVHVDDTGPPPDRPDAPTVVLGHGLLMSGRMFDAQVERLRDRHRCVTIDWRGQGRSPVARGGYDMDTLASDALAVIERLRLGPVHYVGLSMGGFIGMRLAARHPDVVRSLVLLNTSAGPEDPDKVARYRLFTKVYGLTGVGLLRSQVERLMFGRTFLSDPAREPVRDAWLAELRACERSGMARAIRGVTDRAAVLDELGRITAPTLVVAGDEDVATPVAKAEVVAAGIAGARLEVVSRCGHSSTLERPGVLSDLVESFLASSGGCPASAARASVARWRRTGPWAATRPTRTPWPPSGRRRSATSPRRGTTSPAARRSSTLTAADRRSASCGSPSPRRRRTACTSTSGWPASRRRTWPSASG